jgi:endonuclease/exonuclease/phosphatase family metal-dependent hydrolase
VANTHLSFVPGWNRVQLRRLARDLRGFPGPRVLMGDLNMTPPSPERWSRLRPLATAPTFPADAPERQLDHILTDDRMLTAEDVSTAKLTISDHRPLVVDVSRR